MKNTQWYFVIIAAILLLSSCASGPQIPLLKSSSPGEVKLTDIQMPEYVLEDLPYDVILTINSEETPQITRVCFRWLTRDISSYSPSLYCYAMNGTFGTGGPCSQSTSSQGEGSSPFCAAISDINTTVPGRLIVKIRPTDLNPAYNMLEGQVEYVSNGQVLLTNPVRTPVRVER
jgi:hypothetical protein